MVKKRKSGPEKRKSAPEKKVPKLLDEEVEVERLLGHLNVVRREMIKQLDKDDAKDRLDYLIAREMAPLSLRMHFLSAEKHKWGCNFEEAEMRFASIGYIFSPEDGILVHHYLKKKCSSLPIPMNPIKEADVYGTHPLNLIEIYPDVAGGNVWYFFTRSRPNGTSEGGHWIFGKEMNILYQGNKVGVKQLLEYCEGGRKTGYKIDEYRVESPPDHLKKGPWFICKLYKDESCEDVQS
jgi:hypothetical protein